MRLRPHRPVGTWIPVGAVVLRWWVAPGWDELPALSDERRMGADAVSLLSSGEKPWRVARTLGRRWPAYARLMPEMVRSILEQATEAAREQG